MTGPWEENTGIQGEPGSETSAGQLKIDSSVRSNCDKQSLKAEFVVIRVNKNC